VVDRRKLDAVFGVEEEVKDLRIEIASLAKVIAYKTGEYSRMYRDNRKRFLTSGNVFNIVATDISDYDGMEVTLCIGVAKSWASAEKLLKEKAQELSFDERAKAFDQMKELREEGQRVHALLKADLEVIRRQEEAEKEQTISEISKRERKRRNAKSRRKIVTPDTIRNTFRCV
jgi:hypothetical protein